MALLKQFWQTIDAADLRKCIPFKKEPLFSKCTLSKQGCNKEAKEIGLKKNYHEAITRKVKYNRPKKYV